jgi:hypothetical protein
MGILRAHQLVWLGLLLLVTGVSGRADVPREYQLKAAFLYHFAAFVDWPASAFAYDQQPFVIGVFGDDPFGPILDELIQGETAKDRPLVVRRITDPQQVPSCHILFISSSEAPRMRQILRRAHRLPILTVSDAPGFAQAGGVIAFTTEVNRIVLNVNVVAADAAGLNISSKLLRVARVVRGPEAGR